MCSLQNLVVAIILSKHKRWKYLSQFTWKRQEQQQQKNLIILNTHFPSKILDEIIIEHVLTTLIV